jgi:protein-L-isoaspartate O-methyltransferase
LLDLLHHLLFRADCNVSMGPLPHMLDADICFASERVAEVLLPSERHHFVSETAKHRGYSEAASLTAFGPYVQNAHKPGDT